MQSLVSLEGYSPDIKEYLLAHRWPSLVEAMLSGLAVMLPEDPWEFVYQNLSSLKDHDVSDIQWDMFIDPAIRPNLPLQRGVLNAFMDDTDLPTEEMFEKVFNFRRNKLFKLCFGGWMKYHKIVQRKNEEFTHKLKLACSHHSTKMLRIISRKWHDYSVLKRERRRKAILILTHLFQMNSKKTSFSAWFTDTTESKKAKVFFQNRGKGDGDNGDDETWYWLEGEDPISLLPSDVSIKIFSEVGIQALCRCGQVCRSWRAITGNDRLWSKIDVSPLGHFITDESVVQLCTKYKYKLGHLNLRGCSLLSSESFRFIGQCQNLQDLNLSECQGLSEDILKTIGSGLFFLNISYCYVTDSMIRILTKYCDSLNCLSLAYCTHFTSKGLQSIMAGKGCRKLVHLDMSGCMQLTPEAFHYIGQGCPILQTLILNDMSTITDDAVLSLAAHCHTLRHLSFLGGSFLSDRAFKYLALENRKLKSIKIENNDAISDLSLRSLAKSCRDLQLLCIPGCSRISDQGLKAVGSLKKLQVLNIADCSRVSDAGIRYIVENVSGSIIKELNLTNCAKISDVTPLRISQHCRNLVHLSLCYCEHISDTGVELVSRIPSLIDLDITGCGLTDQGIAGLRHNGKFRHLGIADLPEISDDGIAKMVTGLGGLETLDLSACEVLTDAGIQSLAFHCQLLRVIKLASCPSIGDSSVKYISQGCDFIEHIDLSGTRITDQAIRHLRKGCSCLKQVDILSCVNVSKEAVLKLQKACPIINYSTDPPQYETNEDLPNLPGESMITRFRNQ